MNRSMEHAAAPESRRARRLAWMAALPALVLGIGSAQATVQFRWVPTSLELNGTPLGPLQIYNIDFGVTEAAFLSGRASASVTCDSTGCFGPNNGLAAPSFYRNTIDVTLRPDGLVDGSFSAVRASETFSLSGTGLLWSGRYESDYGYRSPNAGSFEATYCTGVLSGGGCTITGYFLASQLTTPGQGVPVPEPSSAALLAVGLLALMRRRH